MVENEMKALRISEAIGAVASRMRVIFIVVIPGFVPGIQSCRLLRRVLLAGSRE